MARIAPQKKQELERTRRDQIVEAAVECWLESGFDAASVAAIATRAGLAKGTVYLYFATKDDILNEAIRRYSLAPNIRGALAGMAGSSPEATVRAIVRMMWTAMKERAAIVQFLVREVCVRPEHARMFFEKVVLPTNELVADNFHRRSNAGEVRSIDWFVAARALVGMLTIFVFTQEVFGGKQIHPLSDDDIVDTVCDLFLRGVLPRTGESDAA